jgi:hypothetical protein
MGATQTTLEMQELTVNHYLRQDRECDACVGYKGNGEPKRCGNTAKYAVLRESGIAEFFCGIHAKDDWKEIADNE